MADLPDVSGLFSSTVQGYATLGASLALGIITIYGYFRKLKVDTAEPSGLSAEPSLKEIVMWLSKLLEAGIASAANTKLIAELIGEQKHQAEIDRAYNKGRDDALDKAAENVARKLQENKP